MRRRRFFLALLLLCAGLWFTRDSWLRWLGHALIEQDPPSQASLVVVLAGDITGERINKAIELVKQQYAPLILVSSAGHDFDVAQGQLEIDYATHRGAPQAMFVLIQHGADSTVEEAAVLIAESRRRGARKILLVTSDYHTRRAARIFRRLAPDLETLVVGSYTRQFDPDTWWMRRSSQKYLFLEVTKTVADWLGV